MGTPIPNKENGKKPVTLEEYLEEAARADEKLLQDFASFKTGFQRSVVLVCAWLGILSLVIVWLIFR